MKQKSFADCGFAELKRATDALKPKPPKAGQVKPPQSPVVDKMKAALDQYEWETSIDVSLNLAQKVYALNIDGIALDEAQLAPWTLYQATVPE
jgi:hypothetical protein